MINSTAPNAPTPTASTRPPSIDDLLTELSTSGMSTAGFARKHGLPTWKLYNALRTRAGRRRKRSAKSALIPVVLNDKPAAPTASLELLLSSGHRLLIPTDFDEAALRRLMGALAGC